MRDQTWNFLIPGDGTHSFRWTGANAFIDEKRIKMNKTRHPNYTHEYKGVNITLERNSGQSISKVNKWRLRVDGKMVEVRWTGGGE